MEKQNRFKKRLSNKAEAFHPRKSKETFEGAFDNIMTMVMNENHSHIFTNDFTRLATYTDIEQVKATFDPLGKIESKEFDPTKLKRVEYIIVTSSSADDIHKAMKYGIWASTKDGNAAMMKSFTKKKHGLIDEVLLFFKIRDDNKFVGCAKMLSNYIEEQQYDLWWERVEWKGLFNVEWLFVKDFDIEAVEGLRKIKGDMNDGKMVDSDVGLEVVKQYASQPFNYMSSMLKLFCVLDRQEDDLIHLRSKISLSRKEKKKNRGSRF